MSLDTRNIKLGVVPTCGYCGQVVDSWIRDINWTRLAGGMSIRVCPGCYGDGGRFARWRANVRRFFLVVIPEWYGQLVKRVVAS